MWQIWDAVTVSKLRLRKIRLGNTTEMADPRKFFVLKLMDNYQAWKFKLKMMQVQEGIQSYE